MAVQKSQKSGSKKKINKNLGLKKFTFLKKLYNLKDSGFKSIQEIKKNFLKKF
jgi:hypothetical protein